MKDSITARLQFCNEQLSAGECAARGDVFPGDWDLFLRAGARIGIQSVFYSTRVPGGVRWMVPIKAKQKKKVSIHTAIIESARVYAEARPLGDLAPEFLR